ncbi:TetR/AcrR family transcriptional regulator [Lipingzhangella sp. LS1_29]|uniref:TetR/AcrR family transcriptional regulator n=1 Tax=Lipingzhangella rawalii TaxID=2055835 RepID=A0ABU2H0S2_9ACTN|nr:TetR/AcrR family transcriptional regulator [Lipingzhangella rawalii]MDS1268906.1 TetR/AcrR family transcriptional regulator [Lipingzhangella rawalii]
MTATPGATATTPATHRGRDPQRRRAILEAADSVIQRDGPDASMAAIAGEAGISKPVLYRHFGDKSGLYRALAERHVEELLARVRSELHGDAELTARARSTIGAYLGMIRANLNLYRFLMHRATAEDPRTHSDVGLMVRRLGEELAELLRREGQVPDPVRAQLLAHAAVGMVQAAGEWLLDQPELAPDLVIEDLTRAVVRVLSGAGDAQPGSRAGRS